MQFLATDDRVQIDRGSRQSDRLADPRHAILEVAEQIVVYDFSAVLVTSVRAPKRRSLKLLDNRFSRAANSRSKSANVFAASTFVSLGACRRRKLSRSVFLPRLTAADNSRKLQIWIRRLLQAPQKRLAFLHLLPARRGRGNATMLGRYRGLPDIGLRLRAASTRCPSARAPGLTAPTQHRVRVGDARVVLAGVFPPAMSTPFLPITTPSPTTAA